MEIRLLKPEEISVRIASVNKAGVELLLYKDARVDMAILDSTFGRMGWKKSFSRENHNCTVSVYDKEKQDWISKEDTGKESYSEAEKGLASDSFKRACFNWGIGVELYSSPKIFFFANNLKTFTAVNGKYKCYDSFRVVRIVYKSNRTIRSVDIENISTHQIFTFENPDVHYEMIIESDNVTNNDSSESVTKPELASAKETKKPAITPQQTLEERKAAHDSKKIGQVQIAKLKELIERDVIDFDSVLKLYKTAKMEDLSFRQYDHMIKNWDELVKQYSCFF